MALTEAEARVLLALHGGAELALHMRQTGRGPYYTLAGRRLSVVTLKALESQRFITRGSGSGQVKVIYALTPEGESALTEWEEHGAGGDSSPS